MRFKKENEKSDSFNMKEVMNSNMIWLIITTLVVVLIPFLSYSSSFAGNNNLESIAVLLISYHGASCIGAIETALSFAKYPERISFFVANADSTKKTQSCLNGYDDNLNGMGSQIIANRIDSITEIFSKHYGTNAVKAELIENEIIAKEKNFDFVMEVYAHSLFNNDWDTEVIAEWQLLSDPKAILTTNPTSTSAISQRSFDHNEGKSMNIICSAMVSFDPNDRDLQILYDHPWEIRPPQTDIYGNYLPVEVPYWSPYFSFGQFEYVLNVKYDPNLKVMATEQGIGFLYSMRLRTNGYRLYAPVKDVIFHNYRVDAIGDKRDEKQMRLDQDRMNSLMIVDGGDESACADADEYGIGIELSVAQFYEIVGVDLKNNSAEFLCERLRQREWNSDLKKSFLPFV